MTEETRENSSPSRSKFDEEIEMEEIQTKIGKLKKEYAETKIHQIIRRKCLKNEMEALRINYHYLEAAVSLKEKDLMAPEKKKRR